MTPCDVAAPSGTSYARPLPAARRPVAAQTLQVQPAPLLGWDGAAVGNAVVWVPTARLAAKGVAPVEGKLRALGRGSTTRFAKVDTGARVATVWENQGELRVIAAAEPRPAAKAPAASPSDDPGVFVALRPPPDVAARLASHGCVAPEDMHLTLAYLGRRSALGDGVVEAVSAALRALASSRPGVVGVTRTTTEDFPGGARYVGVDGDALAPLRDVVVRAVESAGAVVDRSHDFVPHMTLDPKGAGSPRAVIPAEVARFTDLWLCQGRVACERIPLSHPERVERVANAREALRSREMSQDRARASGGWRSIRRANSWGEQARASLERVGALERSYGMVPDAASSLPSASSLAPGMAVPAPLAVPASAPKKMRETLPKAVRAVESILPVLREFPDARRAVRGLREAAASGALCGDVASHYTEDLYDRDLRRADGLQSIALAAVRSLSDSCRASGYWGGYAEHATDLASVVADYLRVRGASSPVDFAVALGRHVGDSPTLSPAPDPTPVEAARAVVAWSEADRWGGLMLPSPSDVSGLDAYTSWRVRLWNEHAADPARARRMAEAKLVRATVNLLRRARRAARTGVDAGTDAGVDIGEAVDSLRAIDAIRTFEVARAVGVSSPSATAYPRVVAAGRAMRAKLEAEVAAMESRAQPSLAALADALDVVARRGVAAYERELAADPRARSAAPSALPGAARAELGRIAAAARAGSMDFNELARVYNGAWKANLPSLPARHDTKHGAALRDAFGRHVSAPAAAAAAEAIVAVQPFASALDRAREKLARLAEPELRVDPWRALHVDPNTVASSYEHTFQSVTDDMRRRRDDR